MRTERATKVRLCQLKSILPYRYGHQEVEVKAQIEILEWVLNMDKLSMKLKKQAIKKNKKNK